MSPVTRDALPEDAEVIARIYNEGIDGGATFETAHRGAADVQAWLLDGVPLVVAQGDGPILAWAAAHPYRPARPVYRGVGEFSVYVAGEHRGTGAGRTVLRALIDTCTERGFWKLVGRTFPENVASRALCASVGFREVGTYRRHARLRGEWRDCVILEILLGDAREGLPRTLAERR